MPVNGFTVGRDIALVIQTAGGPLQVNITDFSADPMFTELKSKPLSGVPVFGIIPDGWKVSFKIDRQGPVLDNYFAAAEAGYYNGQSQPAGTIYETISEPDGSVSQWRYTGVVLKLDKAGDFSGDKKTEQSVSGMAATKVKVS